MLSVGLMEGVLKIVFFQDPMVEKAVWKNGVADSSRYSMNMSGNPEQKGGPGRNSHPIAPSGTPRP